MLCGQARQRAGQELPPAEGNQGNNVPALATAATSRRVLTTCLIEDKPRDQLRRIWLGWKDYSARGRASPLRGRPRRVNTSNGAHQTATTAWLTTPTATPSTADVILPPRHKRESPPVGGLWRLWLGWKDSNLRMAGSKPANRS